MLGRKRCADRLQIIAGIEPFRNLADILAERLAVAQERRAREHIDLGAGIVDVIFPGDVMAGKVQQARQRIAEHRAPAMADMHRAGRIGGDVFDIDLAGSTCRAASVGSAFAQHGAQRIRPGLRLQGEIDEAGPGDIDRGNQIVMAQFFRDLFGEIAWLGLGFLGQHHRGVGRHVAMRGVARRLDHDARQIDAGGPSALGREHAANRMHARQYIGKQVGR